jgi:hypothetical protein
MLDEVEPTSAMGSAASFQTRADAAMTGLALLAFLGAGHTQLDGDYADTIQRGLTFLIRGQSRTSGSLAGGADRLSAMYSHGIATLALSEAYILTRDDQLRPTLEHAVRFTLAAQHPTTGGWRYQPGEDGDTSQFGWHVMALLSAQTAGVTIPQRSVDGMYEWLARVSSGYQGGLASYRPGKTATPSMTAEALVCRLLVDGGRDRRAVDEAARYISRTGMGTGQLNLYYTYYATMGLFHLQDDRWEKWNQSMKSRLLSSQRTTGPQAGSWDLNTVYGPKAGRVYTTAMATLCLETYYRYLPLFDRMKTAGRESKKR